MSDSNSVAAVQEKNGEKEEEQEQEEKTAKNRLLQETEGSISSVGHEPKEQNSDTVVKCQEPQVKVKYVDEGSCAESESMPECISIKLNSNSPPKDLPDNDSGLVAVEKETEELTIR
ncbi:hypothetical protein Tco_0071767, partial [Tanacetum coccineum]